MRCQCWCPGRWHFAHIWTLRTSFCDLSTCLSGMVQTVLHTGRGRGIYFPFFTAQSPAHSVLLYDIDFADNSVACWLFLLYDAQLRCCEHDRRSQVKYPGLPILCCVSITVCCLFSWLIDQLSCSLLNREESFAVIDTMTPLKDLS